jgi:hypothetical protein
MAAPLLIGIEVVLTLVAIGTTAYGAVEGNKATEKAKKDQRKTKEQDVEQKMDNSDADTANAIPIK